MSYRNTPLGARAAFDPIVVVSDSSDESDVVETIPCNGDDDSDDVEVVAVLGEPIPRPSTAKQQLTVVDSQSQDDLVSNDPVLQVAAPTMPTPIGQSIPPVATIQQPAVGTPPPLPVLSHAATYADKTTPQEADRIYYLHIFDKIMSTVLSGESHLFSESEQKILRAFISLRAPTWMRVSGLKYGSAEDVAHACKSLSACDVSDCREVLDVLLLSELRTLAKRRGIKQMANQKKEVICAALYKQTKQATVLSFFKKSKEAGEAIDVTGPLVKLNPEIVELFERLHLIYFRHLLLSLDDNSMKRSTDLFESREAVIQYKQLLQWPVIEDHRQGWKLYLAYRDQWLQHIKYLSKQSISDDGIAYWKRRFTAGWALSRIVSRGAKFAATLKQLKDEEGVLLSLLSQTHYGLDKRGKWYERLILVQATHLRPKKCNKEPDYEEKSQIALTTARKQCIRALDDPHVNREWLVAPERTVYGVRIKSHSQRGASAWDGDDGVPCSVEDLAIWRYREDGYEGIHSENTLMTTLFGLIFYDIIFLLIAWSDSFYFSRKGMIERRIEEIKSNQFLHYLIDAYDLQLGSEIIGVNWEYTRGWLEMICACIGGRRLAAYSWCSLPESIHSSTAGFPDLCLWKPGTNEFLFAEVKGPNDKLSENQKDWIDILLSNDIKVRSMPGSAG
ncbi:hypothetical protein DL89DRAFT_292417 [Linderina pennispora]|uniref:Fanconi-associated nuclease n=1 Tax=Linderina pennispora TaxID=61395 RepID=A0A1Y1WBB0_9FUNG|nr:uncharacterized protein DL89DRAFT_292417 [Linderina pennispora]ORX70821.1 hypothetical protein DL89DRAFT_292417 [Linderina pennispora]